MLKAGIVGLGHGSRVLIDAFRLNNIIVTCIASKKLINANKIGLNKKIIKIHKSWKELVKDKEIDIVAIAVPPYYQIEIIRECIRHKKLLFCEKPIGIKYSEIRRIIFTLSKYNVPFLIDYIYPEHAAFKKFKKIVEKININSSCNVKVNFVLQSYVNKKNIINWKSKEAMGGGIINMYLIHIVDYLIYIFGEIRKIKYSLLSNKKKIMNCNILFVSGLSAEIYINSNNNKKIHNIELNTDSRIYLLENIGLDFVKNFYLQSIIKNNLHKKKIIKFEDSVKNFKGDSRIMLSSRIIRKLKSKKYNFNLELQRYAYNEYILNKIRKITKIIK